MNFINFLNSNSGAIQTLSTITLVIITAFYAWETKKQVEISKSQIENQTKIKYRFTASKVYYGDPYDAEEPDCKVRIVFGNTGLRDINITGLGYFTTEDLRSFSGFSNDANPVLVKPGESIRKEFALKDIQEEMENLMPDQGEFGGFFCQDVMGEIFKCKFDLTNEKSETGNER